MKKVQETPKLCLSNIGESCNVLPTAKIKDNEVHGISVNIVEGASVQDIRNLTDTMSQPF